jgi:Serine carboxypeptidase S28
MPYGSKEAAYSGARSLAYLTAEQALADYATLLVDIKRNMSSEDSPVVLFGGSYAGSKNKDHYLHFLDTVSSIPCKWSKYHVLHNG